MSQSQASFDESGVCCLFQPCFRGCGMFTKYQAFGHMCGSADKSQRGCRALPDELLPGFADAGGGAELDYLGHATNYALTAEAVCTLPHTIGRRFAYAAYVRQVACRRVMRTAEKGETPPKRRGFHPAMFANAHTPEIRRASVRRMPDPRTEWQRFLDENASGSSEYRTAREAAVRRFHTRRFAEEQRLPPGNSPEKETL